MLIDLVRARGVAAACATAWLGCSGLAMAGAGDLSVVVTPLSDAVTYSRAATTSPVRPALNMVIGYTVQIANAGGNTINSIRFTGTASATDPREAIEFASVEGATCTASGGGIDCAIGQLKAGASAPSFAVFFKSPLKVTAAPALPDGVAGQCDTTDCVSFAGTTYYAEGTGGLENSIPPNSAKGWTAAQVTLGTVNNESVKTAVRSGGGSLFTGDGGLTTGSDKFTTAMVVPAGNAPTTAEVFETLVAGCTDLAACELTAFIKAPVNNATGKFLAPYLRITLRVDASLTKARRPDNVTILYYDDNGVTDGNPIVACVDPTKPNGDGKPCFSSAPKAYPKSSRNGRDFPIDLEGDFEFELLTDHNGSMKLF